MNPIKLIPYVTRERIRRALFGKNHFHDLSKFAVQIGCRVAFDIGAERGYESIMFAKAGLRVFAFEPRRDVFAALEANIRDERVWHNVTTFRNAAVDVVTKPGEIKLAIYMRMIDLPDLIKIDTDGDDLRVLAGFPFDTCKPALFSVEWDEAGDVARKLDAEGYCLVYAIYKPQNRWKRAIFSRYSLTPDFRGGEWGDVVGVRPEWFEKFKNQVL